MTNLNMQGPYKDENGIKTIAKFIGRRHPAFFLQFRPDYLPRAHMVYLPPFAEEMNRCRALASAQAREFASQGMSCTMLDFYATGESPGEVSDASLPIWRQNIDDLLAQLLQSHQCPVYLWGCRLGALLALDYLGANPGVCEKLLLWQPVNSGSSFVTQLLRQRSASLMQKGEKPESTAEMKQQLAAGNSFEIAGYRHSGALLSGIDQLEISSILQTDNPDHKPEIFWFEHTSDETSLPGAKARRVISQLEEKGAQVTLHTFTGDPVWQLNKRGSYHNLLKKTKELKL